MIDFKTEEELLERIYKYEFPITSSQVNLKNKKLDYKVLMLMTFLSNKQHEDDIDKVGEDNWRFLYRNKLTRYSDLVESMSNNKIQTVIKVINKMSKLDCKVVDVRKTECNDIIYLINYKTDNKDFVTIETKIMEALIHSFNSNAIKVYILLKYMCRDGERKLSREWIAKQIGLSGKSHNNLQTITNITDELSCGGYINKRTAINEEGKRISYYEVNSIEQWSKIRNKNKRRK